VDRQLDLHYRLVRTQILEGDLVPFLGAGANLCGRPPDTRWRPGTGAFLPSGTELALYLAEKWGFPEDADPKDLVRVAEYISVSIGAAPLYKELRRLFNADYPPTQLHEFLATLPRMLRERGYPAPGQLIVTTNYDDMLERSFRAVGEPFDLVTYMKIKDAPAKFLHIPFDGQQYGEPVVVSSPNVYQEIRLGPDENLARPAILKLHGWVDRIRATPEDSWVITEDHYIGYPSPPTLSNWVPQALAQELTQSNFLFLGYSLRDWNLRVILHRIWGEQPAPFSAWAIQRNPDQLETKFWGKRNVEILDIGLDEYISGLRASFEALPQMAAAT
jgi:hypothetical protein